uniref:E3 ubiquitin-protein ligase UPL5 n=1 Tax=Solanum tuberosum TaxID=4113 RepID=M1DR62_SOLTU
MRMLEEARDGNKEESFEMLFIRSELLEVSFEYIVDKDPALLRNDLLLQFKHEKAIGPVVLSEWFFLVCSGMFACDFEELGSINTVELSLTWFFLVCSGMFACDFEELGSINTVELFPNRKDIVVKRGDIVRPHDLTKTEQKKLNEPRRGPRAVTGTTTCHLHCGSQPAKCGGPRSPPQAVIPLTSCGLVLRSDPVAPSPGEEPWCPSRPVVLHTVRGWTYQELRPTRRAVVPSMVR